MQLVALFSVTSLLAAPLGTGAYADPAPTTVYVVQPGDTLSDLANGAGIDADALARLNGLDDPNLLTVGQSLKVPSTASTPAPAPAPSPSPVVSAPKTYTVVEGDTLWSIAQQFSTTTAALVDANKLDDADRLLLGSRLIVPGSNIPSVAMAPTPKPVVTAAAPPPPKRSLLVSYTVQAGETLTGIARQFEVRPDVIVQASGLDDPNRLSVGAVLKVPLPGHEHLVKAGETLRDIAAQEKVDLGSLIDFNELDDPELIRVGQVVLVPVPPASLQAAAAPTAAVAPTPAPTLKPPPAAPPVGPTPKPAAAVPAVAQATPTPKAAAPVAVVAPPRGAPTDGLAGAGLKLLGAPYVWGGSSPSGFDCSGFVWYVARQVGKPLSRGMFGEYSSGSHPSRDDLKAGDLVFFQNTYSPGLSHNGIYIGNGQFVHAVDESAGVTVSSLNTAYWSGHWFGATRLP
jgi:cell wall-associated NlpC family hydrolase/nucleoid-associated protein YgaU